MALFLVVTGARFWLIHRYALSMPFWDQWDGIGLLILKPWREGTLGWQALFNPHNEHRIFLTRTLSLALAVINGRWDNLLEAGVNAIFCGFGAVLMAQVLWTRFGTAFSRTVVLAVALYFTLPFGWENTLCGFQSQNYFLLVFSLAAVWGSSTQAAGSWGWWIGFLSAVLACLSMASGFLAAAAVLGLIALRLFNARRAPTLGEAATSLFCVGVVAVGWFTRTVVPHHADLKAESFAALVAAFFRFLAWPFCQHPVLGLLALIPIGWLTISSFFYNPTAAPGTANHREHLRVELLLAVGLWALLQVAALAYGRGGHGALPASRYTDLLAVVPLVNFLAWLALIADSPTDRRRMAMICCAALWTLLLAAGLATETVADFKTDLPDHLAELRRGEQNTRGYALTKDFARFLADKPQDDLPYPDPVRLASFVDDPTLRPILPADIRPPHSGQGSSKGKAAAVIGFLLRCGGGIFALGVLLGLGVEIAFWISRRRPQI